MSKRSLIVLSLSLVLITSAVPIPSVHGVLMTPEEVAMLEAMSQDAAESESKGDSTFMRVLKFPVKTIGRLFGIGKKDDGRIQKLSRKDVKKFETVGTSKLVDARTAPETGMTVQPAENTPALDPRLATPQENLERGRMALNSGNLNEAIACLSTAATSDAKLHEAQNLLGVSLATLPWAAAGASPVLAYNVTWWLAFFLNGLVAFAWLRRFVADRLAAFAGSLVFACSFYVMLHAHGHLHLLIR